MKPDDASSSPSPRRPDGSSADQRGTTRLLTGLALLFAVATSWGTLDRAVFGSIAGALHNVGSHIDFRGPYFGALDLASGENPYHRGLHERPSDRMARELGIDRMSTLYSPPVLALYIPLLPLGFAGAKLAFLAVNVICAGLAIRAIARLALRPDRFTLLAVIVLMTAFKQLTQSIVLGQTNVVILYLLCESAVRFRSGKDLTAGSMIGLAALVKPIPGMLLLPIVLRGRWRALAGAGAGLVIPMALSALLYGARPHQDFLARSGALARADHAQLNNQSLHGVAIRSLAPNPTVPPFVDRADLVDPIWLSGMFVVMAAALWACFRGRRVSLDITLWLFLAAGLLVSPRSWDHYFVWLLPALVGLLIEAAESRRWGSVIATSVAYWLLSQPAQSVRFGLFLTGKPAFVFTCMPALGLVLLFTLLIRTHAWNSVHLAPPITSTPPEIDTNRNLLVRDGISPVQSNESHIG
ncbi:MAG: DUF2029 domain-containing protein [Vicinamibacteria bacterium]|nr:DUF2029 domain-containing protein [Vicinamibacteria bacterium]